MMQTMKHEKKGGDLFLKRVTEVFDETTDEPDIPDETLV